MEHSLSKDDSSLVQLLKILHRPVNFEIFSCCLHCQQSNLKKQWSMKYYKQLNGNAIIFNFGCLNRKLHNPMNIKVYHLCKF